ncbi:hypothetical protein KIN20_002780 [Parelaphostrongylus tenuis]|uniref:ZP domain-containing protein n=1 Tax=Parelaphostrongylus tenuis TaxID=148309 RepID=A0AAD5LVR0_PARTN|nr:hypothetical protein KIN20_002780 [Parelaphostrongylus tenuis]
MITTQFREKMYQMPQCTYTLRKGSPDGEIVRYASLGESVYHRWECMEENEKDTFGMLVHSCYVDNGYGDRVDVLSEKGTFVPFFIALVCSLFQFISLLFVTHICLSFNQLVMIGQGQFIKVGWLLACEHEVALYTCLSSSKGRVLSERALHDPVSVTNALSSMLSSASSPISLSPMRACYAEDKLHGCGLDAVLLSTPDYDESLRLATKAYHVFKYADRPVLQFQCQITLCLKYDGGCDGITPPRNCPTLYGESGYHHHHGHRRKAREVDGIGIVDVFTDSITVVDRLPICSTSVSVISSAVVFAFTVGNLVISIVTIIIWISTVKKRRKRVQALES